MDTRIANAVLVSLDEDFGALYARRFGRPSIPPERLQRAMLPQVFYGIPSERQVTERIEFDLLFRWVVGLGVDEAVWDHSSFSTNRERRLGGEIAAKFLRTILAQPRVKRLVSSDHFSVNGGITQASGAAEREAALAMLDRRTRRRRITLGADWAYDVQRFVEDCYRRASFEDRQAPCDRHGSADYTASRLCHQPMLPQTYRGGVRLDGSARFAKVKLRGQAHA